MMGAKQNRPLLEAVVKRQAKAGGELKWDVQKRAATKNKEEKWRVKAQNALTASRRRQ